MRPDELKKRLSDTFCGAIDVRPVPTGYVVSSAFTDGSGDPISFYITETGDGVRIEDDGEYLSHLVGSGVPFDQGQRAQMLDAILSQSGAYWDRETYEIKTAAFSEADLIPKAVNFLSSLIRVRDIELLTRESVRSAFWEDAIRALHERFDLIAEVEEGVPASAATSEFTADVVVRPFRPAGETKAAAIYLVNSNDKLNEALLLQTEANQELRPEIAVVALIEDPEMRLISRKRFQRAQNRSLTMPIFRGDEAAAMNTISRRIGLSAAAA